MATTAQLLEDAVPDGGAVIHIEVRCRVHDEGAEVRLPLVAVRPGGGPAEGADISSRPVPVRFSFPEASRSTPAGAAIVPVTPTAPTEFEEVETGWRLELAAERAERGYVLLRGSLTRVRTGELVRAAGVPFRPIVGSGWNRLGREVEVVLTENRAEQPSLVTEEFPILVAVAESGTYRVDMGQGRSLDAEFDCTVTRAK